MIRSKRQVSSAVLESPAFKDFIARLRDNTLACDAGGKVLRLKRYIPTNARPCVIDEVLDALKENTKIEALYIQNFEDGFFDEQLDGLLDVLRLKRIWCVNVGENFRTTLDGWRRFADGLDETAVAYMYASEHHFVNTNLKANMRDTIREIRKAHVVPHSLSVIKNCKNMWFNPKVPDWAKGLSGNMDDDSCILEARKAAGDRGVKQLEQFRRDSRCVRRGPSKRTIFQTEESMMYRANLLKTKSKREAKVVEDQGKKPARRKPVKRRKMIASAQSARNIELEVITKPCVSSTGRTIKRADRY